MPNLNPQPLKSRKTTPLSAIAIPTLTPIPPPGAELNHVRRVLVQLGKCNRVLPIINTVNTGSVLTDSYTFQEQITGKFVCQITVELLDPPRPPCGSGQVNAESLSH